MAPRLCRASLRGCVALAVGFLMLGAPRAHAQGGFSAALRLANPDTEAAFGGALAGKAGKVAVGPGIGAETGSVYVFDAATGALLLSIANPAPETGDWFGGALAWVGDDLLVAAPFHSVSGANLGVVYLFDGADGSVLHTFTRPDDTPGWFGFSVAALGDDAVIGVMGLLGPSGEGAYLFDGATGGLLATFADPNAGTPAAGRFGRTVVTDGADVFIASSYGASRVYRFDGSGTLLQTYVDPEPVDSDEFGEALAVAGSHLAVGVGLNSGGGKVYLYDVASGALEHTYLPPFFSDSLFFGHELAGVGDTVQIGSHSGLFVYRTAPPYDEVQRLYAPPPFSDDHDGFVNSLGEMESALLAGTRRTAYLFDQCGNGVPTAREQCDDGNLLSGDGCSAPCQLETCGSAPAVGCVAAASSQIQLRKENSLFGLKDALKWTWAGAATDVATLGDPLTTADLSLCIYDRTNTPSPRLRMQPAAPAAGSCGTKPCWHVRGTRIAYADKLRTPSGIAKLIVKTGGRGTKASVIGTGPDLGIAGDPGAISLDGQVTVQLRSRTSAVCLEAEFPVPALLDASGRYRDTID